MDNANMDGKICVCDKCTGEVTCLDEQLPIDKLLPKWFHAGTCYEQKSDEPYYISLFRIKNYDYRVFMVITKKGENRHDIPISDASMGRLGSKLIIVDLLRGLETELKLNSSVDQFDNLSREEICSLFPNEFIPINHQWAMLSLYKGTIHRSEYYTLWLVELQISDGIFTPKDSITIWNAPGREVFCFGYPNVMEGLRLPHCAFITNSAEPNRNLTHFTHFIGFNQQEQKLEIVGKAQGQVSNWMSCILYAGLNGRQLNAFHCDTIGENTRQWVLNLNKLRTYSLDDPTERLHIKDLKLPRGYDHEIGPQRRPGYCDIWRFGWSPNKVTVCLKATPPYLHKLNIFVLNLLTLEWRKLDIDATSLFPKYYTKLIEQHDMFVNVNEKLIAYGTHRVFKDSKWNKIHRFHRIHLRRPATLIELTYHCYAIKLKNKKIQYIDKIVAL